MIRIAAKGQTLRGDWFGRPEAWRMEGRDKIEGCDRRVRRLVSDEPVGI